MAIKEVENVMVWKVQCQECESNMSASGLKSLPLVENFMTQHSGDTGHTMFDIDVRAHTICVKIIQVGKEELCAKN